MSTIYQDTHSALKDLLAMASKAEGATLLIPDLQRPYVWGRDKSLILWIH